MGPHAVPDSEQSKYKAAAIEKAAQKSRMPGAFTRCSDDDAP